MSASVPHQAAGRARGEQTRRQLLAAATELFGEYGLEGATTRDIAQRAGQNIAAITYYFSSKEGLYLAVAQSLADFIQQAFAPLVAEVDRFRQEPAAQRSSDAALRLLQRGLLAFSELMTQPHTLNLSKIMSREQLAPTEAYPLIHSQVIAPMHERLCRLLSAATGIDEHAPPPRIAYPCADRRGAVVPRGARNYPPSGRLARHWRGRSGANRGGTERTY